VFNRFLEAYSEGTRRVLGGYLVDTQGIRTGLRRWWVVLWGTHGRKVVCSLQVGKRGVVSTSPFAQEALARAHTQSRQPEFRTSICVALSLRRGIQNAYFTDTYVQHVSQPECVRACVRVHPFLCGCACACVVRPCVCTRLCVCASSSMCVLLRACVRVFAIAVVCVLLKGALTTRVLSGNAQLVLAGYQGVLGGYSSGVLVGQSSGT
jgi:hypothetical protein